MWKVTVLSILVFSLILIEVLPKPIESEPSADDYRSKCIKLCKNASGEVDFDEETLNCKCTLITNVSEAEMAMVQENAKLLNWHLKPTEDFPKSNSRKRRYISANADKKIFSKFNSAEETDRIVGQAPPLLPYQKPLIPNRPLITQDAALQNLSDIRKRLRELSTHSSRNAAAHAEAIRNSLRELSNRAIIVPSPEQRLHRARMNQERRARERQRIHRLNNFRIQSGAGKLLPRKPLGVLGASADDDKVTTVLPLKVNRKQNKKQSDNHNDDSVVPNNGQHPIITQPEEFIED